MGLISQATTIARLGAIGGFYGIESAALHAALGRLAPQLQRGVIVTVPMTFDSLAVRTRVAREDVHDIIGADQLRRIDLLAPGASRMELELETAGVGLVTTLRVHGGRDVATDCTLLAQLGAGTAALAVLGDAAAALGAPVSIADRAELGALAWLLEFRHANASEAERDRTRERISRAATLLGATAAQLSLVDSIHDMLAGDRDSESAVLLDADEPAPRLAVRWTHVRWETVIRMALGFHPGSDAGTKLGQLSGAFGAELAQSVELLLGPSEPPTMRVAVAA